MASNDPEEQPFGTRNRLSIALDLLNRVGTVNDGVVLDLGCGGGFVTRHIAEKMSHCQVIGIDSDQRAIAQANRNYGHMGNLEFVLHDIRNLSASDLSNVTLVFANLSLHCLPNPQQLC